MKHFTRSALTIAVVGWLAAAPAAASDEIVTYRFRIEPLYGRHWSQFLPPEGVPIGPISLIGWFSGANLNDDAVLELAELRGFHIDGWTLDWHWPPPANPIPGWDTIVTEFSYSEVTGLQATMSGQRSGMRTGESIGYASPFDRLVYDWSPETLTTVVPAGVVPEPATGLLLASGIAALAGWKARRRTPGGRGQARSPDAAKPDGQSAASCREPGNPITR